MNILRAPNEAPWPYGAPGNLARPSGDRSFRAFVDRLAKFSRDGLLDMGSKVLWFPWRENVQTTKDFGHIVTETFGPDVIGLAMMFCPPVDGIDAEEVDFRLLAWELFSLASFAPSDSVEAEAERQQIAARWDDRLGGTALGRLDPRRSANHVRGLWMRGRLLATELLSLPSLTDELPRILLLHDAPCVNVT